MTVFFVDSTLAGDVDGATGRCGWRYGRRMPMAFWLQHYHDNNRSRAKEEYKTSEIQVGLPNWRNDRQFDLCRAQEGRCSSLLVFDPQYQSSERTNFGRPVACNPALLAVDWKTFGLKRRI
jgi:hypothetical protein